MSVLAPARVTTMIVEGVEGSVAVAVCVRMGRTQRESPLG
jgi:hypothetical protein